jgi:dTDP-4-amino-4,6-dideoxy-D-galactose acyltransferase
MITQRTVGPLTYTGINRVASADAVDICSYLDWDSEFFGKRVARFNRSRLEASTISQALAWCAAHRIDCLYFLADPDDGETHRIADQNNFLEVDMRLTLARPITPRDQLPVLSMDSRVRLARESDLPLLRQFARTLHHDSRFYFDQRFERSKCDLLYETWIEKSCHDLAQTVFVSVVDGQAVGYIACRSGGQEAQIGLLGVAETHARTGLGKALVKRFLSWSAQQGVQRATVVTQARNTAAKNLYPSCGFLPVVLQRWYHRWFTNQIES